MKKFIALLFTIFFTGILYNCSRPHSQAEYMPLVTELHLLECRQLEKHGIKLQVQDTSVYTFRSVAFDVIMTKKPEARLIAHYEDLCQKLAALEYNMDDREKLIYRDDFNKEYLKPCN
jgi:hypothetical protein